MDGPSSLASNSGVTRRSAGIGGLSHVSLGESAFGSGSISGYEAGAGDLSLDGSIRGSLAGADHFGAGPGAPNAEISIGRMTARDRDDGMGVTQQFSQTQQLSQQMSQEQTLRLTQMHSQMQTQGSQASDMRSVFMNISSAVSCMRDSFSQSQSRFGDGLSGIDSKLPGMTGTSQADTQRQLLALLQTERERHSQELALLDEACLDAQAPVTGSARKPMISDPKEFDRRQAERDDARRRLEVKIAKADTRIKAAQLLAGAGQGAGKKKPGPKERPVSLVGSTRADKVLKQLGLQRWAATESKHEKVVRMTLRDLRKGPTMKERM